MNLYLRQLTLAVAIVPSAVVLAADADPKRESVTQQFMHAIPNVPGRSLVAVIVDYAPGAKSQPHRHASSAFIYAYVLSGSVRSQVGEAPSKVYRTGESFHELPGAHHSVSENASDTEPARMLVVFVVDASEKLTLPDPR